MYRCWKSIEFDFKKKGENVFESLIVWAFACRISMLLSTKGWGESMQQVREKKVSSLSVVCVCMCMCVCVVPYLYVSFICLVLLSSFFCHFFTVAQISYGNWRWKLIFLDQVVLKEVEESFYCLQFKKVSTRKQIGKMPIIFSFVWLLWILMSIFVDD